MRKVMLDDNVPGRATPTAPSRPSGLFTLRVALVLGVLLPPLWLLLCFTRDERRAHRLVQRCARSVVWLAGCRVRVTGVNSLPRSGSAMLVANHASLADAAILLAAVPADFRFIANHVFADYPILGAAIRRASHHIVDRGSWGSRAACARAMVSALEGGRSLLVFPEGTTGNGVRMLPFRSGAFRAAARSSRPVVPVAIRGTREMFAPGRWMLSQVPVEIEVLAPIFPADSTREGVIRLRDAAASAIAARLDL
jgi:1-acyl-sn-glycerol-3-phosphate acyltransferase